MPKIKKEGKGSGPDLSDKISEALQGKDNKNPTRKLSLKDLKALGDNKKTSQPQKGGRREKGASAPQEEGRKERENNANSNAIPFTEEEEISVLDSREDGEGEGNTQQEEDPRNPGGYVPPSQVAEIVEVSPGANGNSEPSESVSVAVETRAPLPILSGAEPPAHVKKEMAKRKSLPVLGCSSCHIGQSCPEYKEGYVCAFNDAFSAFPARDVDSVLTEMAGIVSTNKGRLMRAYYAEQQVNGGALDMNVTRQSQVVMDQMNLLLALHQEQRKVTVTVHGQGVAKNQGPGILSRLFAKNPANTPPSPTLELNASQSANNGTGPLPQQEIPGLSPEAMAEIKKLEDSPPQDPVSAIPGGQAGGSPLSISGLMERSILFSGKWLWVEEGSPRPTTRF